MIPAFSVAPLLKLNKNKAKVEIWLITRTYVRERMLLSKNVNPKLARFIVNKERKRERSYDALCRTSRCEVRETTGANTLLTYISKNLSFKIVRHRRGIPLNVRCQRPPFAAPGRTACGGKRNCATRFRMWSSPLCGSLSEGCVISMHTACALNANWGKRYHELINLSPPYGITNLLIFHYRTLFSWTIPVINS